MYEYMKGIVIKRTDDYIILDVQNIAYRIYITKKYFKENDMALYYLFYFVNDNQRLLYGFVNTLERDVFLKLISIKSIGIKTAISILKNDDYEIILNAAFNGNYDFLLTLNKINENNVDILIKNLKTISYKDNFSIDKNYYNSLKSLEYSERDIYKSYKIVNKNQPINLMIKEGIKIIESGDLK